MYDAWMSGVFEGFQGSMGFKKPYDCRILSGGKLLTRMIGAEQVLWFNGEAERTLNVFTKINDEDAADRIKEAIDARIKELAPKRVGVGLGARELSSKRREVYKAIFEPHTVVSGSLDYDQGEQGGVIVRAPIRELPVGRAGYVSGQLNAYAYNVFAVPGSLVVWGQSVTGRRWHNLSRPQPLDPRGKRGRK